MENKPLVSIDCITYNHAPYIRQCLDGFLMQETDFDFEVLIHDDASTDGTQEIIREYELKYPHIIKPIYQTENQWSKGISISATYNFPRAQGKYIAFCEGDDYWTNPYKLQKQVDYLENNPNCGLTYGKVKVLTYPTGKESTFGEETNYINLLKGYNKVPTLSVCIRKDVFAQYNKEVLEKNREWKMGDYPLCLYFFHNTETKFINEILGVYRILEESASHSKSSEKLIPYYESIYDIKNYFLNKYNANDESILWHIKREHFNLYFSKYISENSNVLKNQAELLLKDCKKINFIKKMLYKSIINDRAIRFVYRFYCKLLLKII